MERAFEQKLRHAIDDQISFMGNITHFLGMKFDCIRDQQNNLSVYLSQTAFIDTLANMAQVENANPVRSPYRSGYPVDKIPPPSTPVATHTILQM